MPKKYECIAESVLSSAASAITFSSIPGTYTDICAYMSLRKDSAFDRRVLQVIFNGGTSGYDDLSVYGNGTSAASSADVGGGANIAIWDVPAANASANAFSVASMYIPNYTSSNAKVASFDSGAPWNASSGPLWGLQLGASSLTSAITSITFDTGQGGNWVAGSTISLYGISKS